jgi:cyanate permease
MQSLGELIGLVVAIGMIIMALAPYIVGFIFDALNSYSVDFILVLLLFLSSGTVACSIKKPIASK